MKLIKKNRRWLVNDQNFFSLFMTFSLIELANIGSGIIDGLIVSRFFDSYALAAVGLANPMFSICGIVSGLLATGMQILCS
jgi:Na+-driven multidrug efflux pump